MKPILLVGGLLLSAGALAELPCARFADAAPFADGKRVETVWAKADRLVRFTVPGHNSLALFPAEAQFLYDAHNLYVSCKGFEDRTLGGDVSGEKIGSVNNFEIFVRLNARDGDYLHVIADEFGRKYTDINRAVCERREVVVSAERGKDFWAANVVIPFSVLGARAAPADGSVARVGVMRLNRHVPPAVKTWSRPFCEESSFVPIGTGAYAVPDDWAELKFVRDAGPAKDCVSPDRGRRVNLFRNHEFDAGFIGWLPSGKALHRETLAMSGEWTLRASGDLYHFLTASPWGWQADADYTLVVRARSFGGAQALGVDLRVREADGKLRHMGQVARAGLDGEFRDYHFPFHTPSGFKPESLLFYRHGERTDGLGIDLASVRCYAGKVSSFEVRKLVRPNRQAPVAGTEIAQRPNPYGRIPGRMKALALVLDYHTAREAVDIFAGTGIDGDILLTTAKDQDVYLTDSDPDAVVEDVMKNRYDVYLIGRRAEPRIGPELRKRIAAAGASGAGVWRPRNAGRAVDFTPRRADAREGVDDFPYDDLALGEITAEIVRLARGRPAAAPVAKTDRVIRVYAGERHTVAKALDAHGCTVSWTHEVVTLEGPRLGAFRDEGGKVEVDVEKGEKGLTLAWEFRDFSGRILAKGESQVPAIEQSEQSNNRTILSLDLPREKLYTNMGLVRLRLLKGAETLDVRTEDVYVPGNDARRVEGDFEVSHWPIGNEGYYRNFPAIYRQLEDIGVGAMIITVGGGEAYPISLRSGMCIGSDAPGGGSRFCGRPQKSHVREPNLNTVEARRQIAERAARVGKAMAKYGPLHSMICDEPNLCYPGTADELDEHPENLAEYRRRMESAYGTIGTFNRRHGTSYGAFSEIGPGRLADARASGRCAEFVEWRNFNVDRWCEVLKLVSDGVTANSPVTRFCIGCSFGQTAFTGNDYWKLLTRAGLGIGDEYTQMVYFGRGALRNYDELYRSFRPDMRVWCCTGFFFSDERMSFLPWWTACHRYGGFSWFAATSWGYNLLDEPGYGLTVDGKGMKDTLARTRMKDGLGMVLTSWRWAPNDIAIYYSHESMLVATALGQETKSDQVLANGPLHDYLYSRQGATFALENLLYQYDFVAPEQVVSSNRLSGVKALFMPRILAMGDAEVAAVKDFLKRGGRMICDVLPGDRDELGMPRAANPFAGHPGVTVLGANFDDENAEQRKRILAWLEQSDTTKALASPDIADVYGREAMHYVSGDADVYCVLRMPGRSKDVREQTFVFARKGHVYDVRAQRYLGVADRVTAAVPNNEASVFAVLPMKVAGIGISGLPATVAAGSDLGLDFSIGDGRDGARPSQEAGGTRFVAAVPAYVLHVEFVPPTGKPRFHFKRNLLTKGGRAHLDFATALNDESGVWTVRVSEPLTGMRAEKKFELKGAR